MNPFRRLLRAFSRRAEQHLSGVISAKRMLRGYLSYVIAGWILLCLPFTHKVSGPSLLDHLFVATSAVSTTGLTTISVSDSYNLFGQLIILALIQVGGIGYMTFGSFVVLQLTSKLSSERSQIGRAVYGLPSSFPLDTFIRDVIRFTLIAEGVGAVWLAGAFYNAGFGLWHSLWSGVFHSVSAFCTAGFSLYNTSFEQFAGNLEINGVIALLSYLGAIGFLVCSDVLMVLNRRKESLTLTSRVIVSFTLCLMLAGTALLFAFEPALQPLSDGHRLLRAFFQTMAAMTTVGFNTLPIGLFSKASILLLTVLMVIGASPAGTGGGLKSTSFAGIIGVMGSILRGKPDVRLFGQPVSGPNILTAVAALGYYLTFLVCGTYLLGLTDSVNAFDQNFFEAASALGTVGLSMGITASLTYGGKIVVILLMFCGRLNPLTFGMAFFGEAPPEAGDSPDLVI